MPNSNNIAEWIQIGKLCIPISIADINRNLMLNKNNQDELLPYKLRLVNKAVQFGYANDNNTARLDLVNEYQIALCGRYTWIAMTKLGNVEGIVITPALPPDEYLTQLRQYTPFLVGAVNAPMVDGDTVLVITDSSSVPESDLGEVEIHIDGLEEGQDFAGRSNFSAVWTLNTYTITFSPPVRGDGNPSASNLISIKYPIRTNITVSTAQPTQDLIYTATVIGATTETLYNQLSEIFQVSDDTSNVVKFIMFCISTTSEIYIREWEATVTNIAGANTIMLSNDNVLQDDFGGTLTAVISADDALGGVKIEVTGITAKTINCRATFTYSSASL
jgi:hypothetical protein